MLYDCAFFSREAYYQIAYHVISARFTSITVDPHISEGNGTDPTSYMLKIRI